MLRITKFNAVYENTGRDVEKHTLIKSSVSTFAVEVH